MSNHTPKKGDRWRSKTGSSVAVILSYSAGVVKFRVEGQTGHQTKGILRFRELYER